MSLLRRLHVISHFDTKERLRVRSHQLRLVRGERAHSGLKAINPGVGGAKPPINDARSRGPYPLRTRKTPFFSRVNLKNANRRLSGLGLMALNRELVAQAEASIESQPVVLDMDSTESPVYGQQEGSVYNGHFESICYHPLLLFNSRGDCPTAKLRPGNEHSAEDWDELQLPEIERQQAEGKQVTFRADAAFAKPEIYEALEERDVQYAIRIPANKSLELETEDILFRPPGRPSRKPLVRYKSFRYQAASWSKPRRIVAKVEHHPGELFAQPGFIVTNMTRPSRSVVRFYNKRGTAEQWIKEGKQATNWTRLSCHRFRANEVRLQLSVLAYNLGNLWRRLGLPPRIKNWSLTSLQQRLVKTGGRLIKHARYYWLLLAEGYLNRRLFGDMLRRIWALPVPGG